MLSGRLVALLSLGFEHMNPLLSKVVVKERGGVYILYLPFMFYDTQNKKDFSKNISLSNFANFRFL